MVLSLASSRLRLHSAGKGGVAVNPLDLAIKILRVLDRKDIHKLVKAGLLKRSWRNGKLELDITPKGILEAEDWVRENLEP